MSKEKDVDQNSNKNTPSRKNQFFGCYLLISRSTERFYKNRTYIGFTVDPIRRLKQHNAGCKSGGARRTSNRGPWDMVLVVYGFPNEISALRFEWAWQNPQNSRRLSKIEIRKSAKEKQIDFRLRVLNEMLNCAPWNRLALNINWLNSEFRKEFAFPLEPPDHMKIFCAPIIDVLKEYSNLRLEIDPSDEKICFICSSGNEQENSTIKCTDRNCRAFYHMTCLAGKFLEKRDEFGEFLIPLRGHCPSCFTSILWTDLLRFNSK